MENVVVLALAVIAITLIAAVFGLLLAIPVMLLWNWLIPDLFHGPVLSYWQAYGLYLLCAILFKSSSSGSSKS